MRVCGIDYSSHAVDLVTVPLDGDGPPSWDRFMLTGADAFERTRHVSQVMFGAHHSFWDGLIAVGIEHPAGRYGTGPLMRLQGAILSCIPARMLVEPLPPGKWRKLAGMAGNAPKDDVKIRSIRLALQGGEVTMGWPQDAHDAHLIALATRHLLEHPAAA